MTPILIDNKNIYIADCWEDVTVDQFVKLISNADCVNPVANIIAALTGIDYDVIESMKCDVSESVMSAISFVGNVPDFSAMKTPDKITIGDKLLPVIKDITEECFGQKIMVQQKINDCVESGKDLSTLIAFTIATYFQPAFYNEKYSGKKAEEFEQITKHCKILEAFPVANFFLSRYINSQQKKTSTSTSRQQKKNSKQALKDLTSSVL